MRRVPAQYLWIHRRFKGLTPDYPDYYERSDQPQRLASRSQLPASRRSLEARHRRRAVALIFSSERRKRASTSLFPRAARCDAAAIEVEHDRRRGAIGRRAGCCAR